MAARPSKIRVNPQNPRRPRCHYSYEGRSRTNSIRMCSPDLQPLQKHHPVQLQPAQVSTR
jgi:hypothetical protein